jgi:hypothetical protein
LDNLRKLKGNPLEMELSFGEMWKNLLEAELKEVDKSGTILLVDNSFDVQNNGRLIGRTICRCINTYIKHITVGAKSVLVPSLNDLISCRVSFITNGSWIWKRLWKLISFCSITRDDKG